MDVPNTSGFNARSREEGGHVAPESKDDVDERLGLCFSEVFVRFFAFGRIKRESGLILVALVNTADGCGRDGLGGGSGFNKGGRSGGGGGNGRGREHMGEWSGTK